MTKILFVCTGNVSRSQMAEAFYNHFTKSKNASSAGIVDYTPEEYGHPVKEIVDVMLEEGIDVSKNKVKTITKKMIENADKIIVMCKKEKCPDFLLDSKKVIFWYVEDPFGMDLEGIRKSRDIIKEKVLSII